MEAQSARSHARTPATPCTCASAACTSHAPPACLVSFVPPFMCPFTRALAAPLLPLAISDLNLGPKTQDLGQMRTGPWHGDLGRHARGRRARRGLNQAAFGSGRVDGLVLCGCCCTGASVWVQQHILLHRCGHTAQTNALTSKRSTSERKGAAVGFYCWRQCEWGL